MFKKSLATVLIIAGAAFLPEMANAATFGYTIGGAALRAGPDEDYPIVRVIRPDARVYIYGCLNDWSWCDVSYRDDRGWIDGDRLAVDYRGRRRDFIGVAPYLGIGFLYFSFGDYWGHYYRDRPFYSQRGHWEDRYYQRYRPSWGPRPERRDYDRGRYDNHDRRMERPRGEPYRQDRAPDRRDDRRDQPRSQYRDQPREQPRNVAPQPAPAPQQRERGPQPQQMDRGRQQQPHADRQPQNQGHGPNQDRGNQDKGGQDRGGQDKGGQGRDR